MTSPSYNEDPVRVFVFPQIVTFYADDVLSHKQILTINNPYGFMVFYKIKCSDPSKYIVSPAEGSIKSLNAQEIVVKCRAVLAHGFGSFDVLRVELMTYTSQRQKQFFGSKDIRLEFLASRPESLPGEPPAAAANMETLHKSPGSEGRYPHFKSAHDGLSPSQCSCWINVTFCWVAFVVCAVVLCVFPSETEVDDRFPMFLHLHHTTRLFFAFFLGMIIMYIFLGRFT